MGYQNPSVSPVDAINDPIRFAVEFQPLMCSMATQGREISKVALFDTFQFIQAFLTLVISELPQLPYCSRRQVYLPFSVGHIFSRQLQAV